MSRRIFSLVVLLAAFPLAASTRVLLPTIVANAQGARDSVYSAEVRVINRSDTSKQFAVVDWIGTPGWKATTHTVEPHATLSLGGRDIFAGQIPGFPEPRPVGLAVCEADEGLIVQTALLGGPLLITANDTCESYDGGGAPPCGPFAGPIVEGVTDFFPAGREIFIPWLHTILDRRTNLALFNPNDVPSQVRVTLTSQDGRTSESGTYIIAPHSRLQLNDIFSKEPWIAIRIANRDVGGAASATITSDTRLYAVAYVISYYNNSLSVSLPR